MNVLPKPQLPGRIIRLSVPLRHRGKPKTRILVNVATGMHVIRISDILMLKADSNYTRIMLRDGRAILASRVLNAFALELKNTAFVRTHQSFLVNLEDVAFVSKDSLQLQHGMKIPVARSKAKIVVDALQIFARQPSL